MRKSTLIAMGIGAVAGVVAGKCVVKYIKSKPVEQQKDVATRIEKTIMIAGGAAIVALMNKCIDSTQKMTMINRIDIILSYNINDEEKINLLTDLKHAVPFKDIKALIESAIQDVKGGM